MDKNSTPNQQAIEEKMEKLLQSSFFPPKYRPILKGFYRGVKDALVAAHRPLGDYLRQFDFFLHLVEKQLRSPFSFSPYHQKVRKPIDYYRFSIEFIRPLVDFSRSTVRGLNVAATIEKQMKKGENAVLLANHQTEPDPQAIAILLEKTHPEIAQNIIYVAGERVVTDPLAIPFSMGCDLLCIYSKRYIDHPPELKAKKQLHNKSTMEQMSRLLAEGGKVIYVAPSGGRDRRGPSGKAEVAPFDPQSIEMFYLMAKKAKTPTHFYPLALSTYDLLPPPDTIQVELGETRTAKFTPIHLSFSPEFDMDQFPGSDAADKAARRQNRANAIWNIVNQQYQQLQNL